MSPKTRLASLDSLRGVAAFIVLVSHVSQSRPSGLHDATPLWVNLSPVRVLLAGPSAVTLFFVLSGYVLTIPLMSGARQSFGAYALKRLIRIYLPFSLTTGLAALLYAASTSLPDGFASDWFQAIWNDRSLTAAVFGRHLAMTGLDSDQWLDPVMWSLVYELRISLFFPLIVLLARNPPVALAVAAMLYVAAAAAASLTGNGAWLTGADSFTGTALLTARFTSFFILGSVLARNNGVVAAWLGRTPRLVLGAALVAALGVFAIPPDIHNQKVLDLIPFFNNGILKYCIEFSDGLAAALFIVSARNIPRLTAGLEAAPLRWLGKISYSLYLIHLPVLCFTFRHLLPDTGFYASAAVAITASLVAAEIFHTLAERPAMHLGRVIGRRQVAPQAG